MFTGHHAPIMTLRFITIARVALLLYFSTGPQAQQIPGTRGTDNGYDVEMGTEQICWSTPADADDNRDAIPFPNPLIETFRMPANSEVTLLRSCPEGNVLSATAPDEYSIYKEVLRTGRWYDYHLEATLDLRTLQGDEFISDQGNFVAVQVLVCLLSSSGFCSPFVHEQANERLEALDVVEELKIGDEHGGTHVHSPYVLVEVPRDAGPVYKISLKVPLQVNDPGSFFAIGALQMYSMGDDGSLNRFDMANALSDYRLLAYQDPPVLVNVPSAVLSFSYVAISIASLAILYLLVETIRHRNNQVLQLSQAPFLIVFLGAALVTTVATFLLEPRNDLFCRASTPIILIGVQLIFAIAIGRLWRIHAVISPLLLSTLRGRSHPHQMEGSGVNGFTRKVLTCFTHCVSCFGGRTAPKSLRKKVSSLQLSLVVCAFVLPQIILQMLSVTLQPMEKVYEFNAERSNGRAVCQIGVDVAQSFARYGFLLFVFMLFVLLAMAYSTRNLPSLLNETHVIFDSVVTTIILIVLGVSIVFVSDDVSTSPAVPYLVWVTVTISLMLNSSIRTMLPKLRMVWSGEVVLVSRLVSDQGDHSSDGHENVTGLYPPPTDSRNESYSSNQYPSTHKSRSEEVIEDLVQFEKESTQFDNVSPTLVSQCGPAKPSLPDEYIVGTKCDVATPDEPIAQDRKDCDQFAKRRLSDVIVINHNEAPARRLVLKMLDCQKQLARINERIMCGLTVSEEDWLLTRRLSHRLATTLSDEVKFSWEDEMVLLSATGQPDGGREESGNELSSMNNVI